MNLQQKRFAQLQHVFTELSGDALEPGTVGCGQFCRSNRAIKPTAGSVLPVCLTFLIAMRFYSS